MAEYGVVLFHTTSATFAAEKVVKKASVDAKLIPTPRQFSSDCGVALRVGLDSLDDVVRMLNETCVEIAGTGRLQS